MRVHRGVLRFALLLTLAAASLLAFADDVPGSARELPAAKVSTPPVIDGDLSDSVWAEAATAETFYDLRMNTVAADQTVVRICFDDRAIYVSFYCKDSQPGSISAKETIRDSKYTNAGNGQSPNREDNVTVSLDPFFSKNPLDVSLFSVNAIGTPSAKLAGGRGGKVEWKGDWPAAATRVADGWTAELEIPWAILNFPTSAKLVNLGINFFRFQDRTKTLTCWSNMGPQELWALEGVWREVAIPKREFKPKLSLLPYILPGVDEDGFTLRSGVDARFPLSPELTAVGSLNPDFGTIEGAVEGIAFSRSERFVPERRPFFLEGSDYFNFGTQFNDIGAFFYPRRIRTFDLGTKIYGKLSPKESIGFLNTITFGERTDTVVRYRKDIEADGYLGLFANQRSLDGVENGVFELDRRVRKGNYRFESQFAKSSGPGADGGAVVLSGYHREKLNTVMLQYHTISNRFVAPDGFIPFTGYSGFVGMIDRFSEWRTGDWRNYNAGIFAINWKRLDGEPYWENTSVYLNGQTRGDWYFGVDADYGEFEGAIDNTYTLRVISGATNRFRQFGARFSTGRQSGLPWKFVQTDASVRLTRNLIAVYGGAIQELDNEFTRQNILTLSYELSPTRSIGGRLVSQDGDQNWYVSYRNSGKKGTEMYVILGDPNARKFRRVAQVKLVFSY